MESACRVGRFEWPTPANLRFVYSEIARLIDTLAAQQTARNTYIGALRRLPEEITLPNGISLLGGVL